MANPTGRRFLPTPANSKPFDLFGEVTNEQEARFVSKTDPEEMLIFISGICNTEDKGPDRAIYTCVWGPSQDQQDDANHKVGDLTEVQPTADRSQLHAAYDALHLVLDWRRIPRRVVLAFSGNYFLNQVARSTYKTELAEQKDNLDLKFILEKNSRELKEKGVTVRFWLIDEDNMAEDLAYSRLSGKEQWSYTALKAALGYA